MRTHAFAVTAVLALAAAHTCMASGLAATAGFGRLWSGAGGASGFAAELGLDVDLGSRLSVYPAVTLWTGQERDGWGNVESITDLGPAAFLKYTIGLAGSSAEPYLAAGAQMHVLMGYDTSFVYFGPSALAGVAIRLCPGLQFPLQVNYGLILGGDAVVNHFTAKTGLEVAF